MTATITAAPVSADTQRDTLIALLGEEKGLAAYARLNPEPAPEPTPLETLIAAGFSPEDAAKALAVEAEPEPTPEPTSAELAEALVEAEGLTFAKGRIYADANLIRAMGEAMRTGDAVIVPSERDGRSILVYKNEGAEVASVVVQNLIRPKAKA